MLEVMPVVRARSEGEEERGAYCLRSSSEPNSRFGRQVRYESDIQLAMLKLYLFLFA
jgi:hypothetical protein